MKNIKKIRVLALLVLFMAGSCEDALEETPYSFISPEQMEDSNKGVELWVNGVRSSFLNDGFFRYEIFNRAYEMDQDDITGPRWFYSQTGAGNFANADDLRAYWTSLYLLINRANFAIPYLQKMQNVDPEIVNNAIGELNFYKGWAYFTLVKAFGGVPLYKKSVADGESISLPRSSVPEVYEYIIEVLKDSEKQLYARNNPNYEIGEISQEAAKTMLAKVYVTMASGALAGASVTVLGGPQKNAAGQRLEAVPLTFTKDVVAGHESFSAPEYFRLAKEKAKEVIDVANSGYITSPGKELGLFSNWNAVWNKSNRGKAEHLWMLYSEQGRDNSGMVLTFHYSGQFNEAGNMLASSGIMGLSDHWYDLFETKDRRVRDGVIHQFSMHNPSGNPLHRWYPRKEYDWAIVSEDSARKFGYDDPKFKPVGGDQGIARVTKFADVSDKTLRRTDAPYPFLRYAETLLIYAEAANELEGPASAVEYINMIRRRSGATEISAADFNQQSMRSFILEERRRELALEGNRPWDLRRWGIYLQVMNAIGPLNDINSIVKVREPRHLLFPLPIVEITGNTAINGNNPGW